jgi:hypothetical protein
MQIETTMRYDCTATNMAVIQKENVEKQDSSLQVVMLSATATTEHS